MHCTGGRTARTLRTPADGLRYRRLGRSGTEQPRGGLGTGQNEASQRRDVGVDVTTYLAEADPRWAEHSGEEGHYEAPEWGPEDLERAAVFLTQLAPQARQVFEYLLRNPGRRIHCTELVDKVLGGPNGSDPARRVAGVLSGTSKGHGNSGRRYPFYWWEAPEGSAGATYAVRPSVAAVFLAAQLDE
ncbi:DUF6416 domain-containing protein [Streptomyces sp. NPDC018955]|uniref:DUF6416 domain-containing protein n=1 Tax=Streptomyces sp. NPDC018955 TaxID=3365055 RepID=UPI00379FDEC4